jgi:hypothetical protein
MKIVVCLMLGGAALALSGCNSSAPPPQASAPQARAAMTPSDFKLPQGGGCGGEIARYKAVIDNDHSTGNVNDSVWKQIEGEIASASAACSSGNEAQALGLLRASKSRHGYPG